MRKTVRSYLTRSLWSDREQLWIKQRATEEKSKAIGNSRNHHRLTRFTDPRIPGISKLIKKFDSSLIHLHETWDGNFRERFSWPIPIVILPSVFLPVHADIGPPIRSNGFQRYARGCYISYTVLVIFQGPRRSEKTVDNKPRKEANT